MLAHRLVSSLDLLAAFAERELESEPAARDLVEGLTEQDGVVLLGELAVERRARRELERQRVALERGGAGLGEDGGGVDRPLLNGWEDGALPGFLELLELQRGRRGRRLGRTWLGRTCLSQ